MCLYVMMNDRKKSNIPVLFSLKSCKDLQSQGSILSSTILLLKDVLSMLECCHLEEKTLRYAFHCLQSQAEYDKKNYKFLYFFL